MTIQIAFIVAWTMVFTGFVVGTEESLWAD